MAKQAEDLVIRILRDIQRTQAEHTKNSITLKTV